MPVYSLVTYDGESLNMNIMTYVSCISLQPKCYALSVYKNTKSIDNIEKNKTVVLQLLSKNQIDLVKYLGKQSGRAKNKESYLKNKNLLLEWHGFKVLNGCAALLKLNKTHRLDFDGDHILYCFRLLNSKTIDDKNVLMFQDLVDAKIIL